MADKLSSNISVEHSRAVKTQSVSTSQSDRAFAVSLQNHWIIIYKKDPYENVQLNPFHAEPFFANSVDPDQLASSEAN